MSNTTTAPFQTDATEVEDPMNEPLSAGASPDMVRHYEGSLGAVWSLVIALGFAAAGVFVMFSDEKLVGGDAYNLMVTATRGVAFIGVGILFAVMACTFAVMRHAKQQRGA